MKSIIGSTLSELLAPVEAEAERSEEKCCNFIGRSEVWYQQGVELLKSEEFLKAAVRFGAVVLVDPENLKAMNNLAVSYYNMGELTEALRIVEDVLNIDPKNITALKNKQAMTGEEV